MSLFDSITRKWPLADRSLAKESRRRAPCVIWVTNGSGAGLAVVWAEESARSAATYLGRLHDKFKDWRLALAAYNSGEGTVQNLLKRHKATTYDELKARVEKGGFVDAFWCGDHACENKIKDETKATNRCMPINQPGDTGPCIVCGKQSNIHALFARAY